MELLQITYNIIEGNLCSLASCSSFDFFLHLNQMRLHTLLIVQQKRHYVSRHQRAYFYSSYPQFIHHCSY